MSGTFLELEYNRNNFISFLTQNFLPTDFEQSQNKIVVGKSDARIKNAVKLGHCPSLGLSVYEFRHNSILDPRVSLSRESFDIIDKNETEPNALAVFYNENVSQWRLSLITSDYTFGRKKGHVERKFSNPRRFSYLLGEGRNLRTPQSMLNKEYRVKSEEDLVSRFAIEVVTKQFYRELFNWYDSWAIHLVNFPTGIGRNAKKSEKPDMEKNRQHLIRLITRLIFVWFLKQKEIFVSKGALAPRNGLVPSWIFDEKEIAKILNNFDAGSEKQGDYYNAIIQNLFFATLNKPIKERGFAKHDEAERTEDYSIKTKFRDFNGKSLFSQEYNPIKHPRKFIDLFNSIPFLNGGLFECLDDFDSKEYVDGFSREPDRAAFVPNCLFWGNGEHEGLVPLLERYNFTVEENTPQDIDIALDPELLGKVFENLLGTFNEETKSTARKESGSFYTPREIVDYMVDASLKEYFKGKLGLKDDDFDIGKKLDSLFSYKEEEHEFDQRQAELLIDAINKCKILDPACGSGAFPMGILNKLAFILHKLDPNNEKWRKIQIEQVGEDTKKAYAMRDKEKRDKHLEEIHRVFEMSTGEYSNYARKLFLIENCIYGVDIQPIAIQISKLRFFISLIADQKTDGNIDNNYNVIPLPNLETKFVAANSLIGIRKGQLDLLDNDIENIENELLVVRQNHFSVHEAIDKINLRRKGGQLTRELVALLERDLTFKSTDIEKITRWNPYKQSIFADFFDPLWMFNVKSFEIVISNPPYIQLQLNHGELADLFINEKYDCFSRSGDVYQLFYEHAYKLLSDKGHLCFITSNKWMRAAYGEKTRNFFSEKANPKLLIDFAGQRVFETATVDVNILLVQKDKNQQNTKSCVIKEDCKNNMTDYVEQFGNSLSFPANWQSWVILSDIEKRIKEKIEKAGKPLKDWDVNIYRGVLTGCNEAFIIDKTKRDDLIAKDKKSAEIIRPILRGRDIKRYGYEFAEQYIIATFPSKKNRDCKVS